MVWSALGAFSASSYLVKYNFTTLVLGSDFCCEDGNDDDNFDCKDSCLCLAGLLVNAYAWVGLTVLQEVVKRTRDTV